MPKRSIRATAGERQLRGVGMRGERPSRRAAVHARRDSVGPARRRPGAGTARPVLMAMKRAMRHTALRDCGQRCVYCASPLDAHSATLDHVHPLARGGAHDPANVVVACGACNRMKGDLLPQEFFMRFPWAGQHFLQYARTVHRALKRIARRAVSLACAEDPRAGVRGRVSGHDRLAA